MRATASAPASRKDEETTMRVTLATMRIRPDKAELYEATFLELRELVLANEPGTTFFELCRDPADPIIYRVFEAYRDADAIAEHVATDYYDRTARIFVTCLEGDHVERAAAQGITEPREIYKLAGGSLRLDRYESV
jgi:quinol monooxygenase YgiN